MRYLLDTSVLLFWAMAHIDRLSAEQQTAIRDGRNEVYVSAISAAEVRVKVSIGKLAAPSDLFDALGKHGFRELPLTIADTTALDNLPLLHRDPFDRMLVVQALAHGLKLITSDERLKEYPVATL